MRVSTLFIALVACAAPVVWGGWSIKPPLGKTNPIVDSQLNAAVNPSSMQYTYTHSSAQFYPSVGQGSAIFPNSCVGDAANPYGWNYFKSQIVSSVTIGFSGDITIRYQPAYGFSLLKPEIITCGPFVDSDGKPLYSGVLPVDDQLLTFQITVNSNPPLIDLRQMQSDGVTLAAYGSKSVVVNENLFRNSGIQIYIVLSYDNWNATRMYDIGAQLVCTPLAVNCFSGIVQPKHWSMWAPNVVLLNVPRDDARTFNIFPITTPKPQNWVVQWSLSGITDSGKSFTTKGLGVQVFTSSTQFNVIPYANPAPQLQLLWRTPPPVRTLSGIPSGVRAISPTVINMTEDCIRGKTTVDCPLELIFSTFTSSTQPQLFAFDPNAISDTRKYAIVSQTNNFSNFNWVYDLQREPNFQKQMAIIMNPIPFYETWVVDTMTVMPPYTVLNVLEPPVTETGSPFQIVVTPSIGSVIGLTRDVTQREIVEGGFTFEYAMDGESFSQATLNNFVTLMVGFNLTDAWTTLKASCVLPPGSITYGVTPWKTPNTSSILVRFQPCPDFETLYPDIVTVTLTPGDIRSSMWPIRVRSGMSFRILKSPGAMTFLNSSQWSQGDFIGGNVSFYIKLTSERWPADASQLQNCFNNICDYWTTNVPQSSKDNAGWGTQARRSAICANAFTKINDRLIRFQGVADSLYRTRIGEKIFVSVPAYCAASGTAPEGNQTLVVSPQSGIVSLLISNGTSIVPLTRLTERQLRNGGFQVIVNSNLDSFDDTKPVTVANEMMRALISNGSEAEGFNNKKSLLISNIQLNPSNPYQMIITFQKTYTYDISSDETVFLNFSATWMASQSLPSPRILSFSVGSAPGTVAVDDWFGSTQAVTEDDIRAGRVWFRFSLLGDQWRREREPYLSIWNGDIPSTSISGDTFTFTASALIPDVTFFNFSTSAEGYDYFTLSLQSDENYDIPQRETVKISFPLSTVASGIPPVFDSTNTSTGTSTFWTFFVDPTPGRVLLSGTIYNVNEKLLRQSGTVYWYLTLIGETWIPNVSAPFSALVSAYNTVSNPSDESAGFLTYKSAFLPASRITTPSSNVLRLFLAPNTNYQINFDETIRFYISGSLVNSGLQPYFVDSLEIPVQPTGGELGSPTQLVVTEDFVRKSNFTWSLSLAGDQWNTKAILQDPTTFLKQGFSSKSPTVQEKSGFLANKDDLLHISNSPIITQDFFAQASTIIVHFFPTPNYNIDSDEIVTFTVASASFVGSREGFLPNPATISFTIKAVPQQIVVIINQRLDYTSSFESVPETFSRAVAALMSLPDDRVVAVKNATAHRVEDDLLVMLLTFTATASTDSRTSAFLTSTFLSLSTDYLYGIIGANYTYLLASPPDEQFLHPRTPAPDVETITISWSTQQIIIWSCVGVATLLVLIVLFYVLMKMQENRLAVGVLAAERKAVDPGVPIEKWESIPRDLLARDEEAKLSGTAFKERERIAKSKLRKKDDSPNPTAGRQGSQHGSHDSEDLGPVIAKLSTGERVVKPMTLKEYVRKVVDHEDPNSITHRDLVRGGNDSDDERAADFGRAVKPKSSIGDQLKSAEAAELRRRNLFQESSRPTAKLDAEGKTEAELSALRKRGARSEPVNRRLTMVDTLVDF